MSLDKAIKSGKEHRKQYRGSKAIDPSCRNHGSCYYCSKNRTHKFYDKRGNTRPFNTSLIDDEEIKSEES